MRPITDGGDSDSSSVLIFAYGGGRRETRLSLDVFANASGGLLGETVVGADTRELM